MSEAAQTTFGENATAPVTEVESTPLSESAPHAATEQSVQGEQDRSFLPEGYREDARFSKFNSVEDLAKSYLGAESLIGKSIRIPSTDAGEKQRNDFYSKLEEVPGVVRIPSNPEDADGFSALFNKMGRPDTAEGYSSGTDQEKELYHKLGLSESQAAALNRANARTAKTLSEQEQKAVEQAGEALKAELGDGFDRAMKNSMLAAHQFGGDDFIEQMKTNPLLGNNVQLIGLLASVGEKLGEGKVPLNSAADSFNLTKQEVEQQIEDLRQNEAYQNREQWALDKMRMLYQKISA